MFKELLTPSITASRLAEEYGCSEAYISQVANGKKKPSTKFKIFCSRKFGLPVSTIFPEVESKQ